MIRRTFATLALAAAVAVAVPAAAEAPGFKLVVNKANPATALDRAEVARMFMKQAVKWPGGAAVEPVDQAPSSAVRARFSTEVLGKDASAVQSAWQRIIFSGRGVPPPEVAGDGKVLYYVAEHAGGIGYVSESAPTEGVKVIDVTR